MEPTQTQQPNPQSPPRPRLERLRSDRAVAGVASGLARYLGVDVAWIRIGFVVLALFGGSGILLYLIGWLAIPQEGEHDSIVVDRAGELRGAGSWIGIGLIVLAGMIVLGNTGLIQGELIFAAALVAVGVLLYRGDIGGPRPTERVTFEPSDTAETPAEFATPTESALGTEETPLLLDEEEPAWSTEEPAWRTEAPIAPTPPPPPDPAFVPREPQLRESSPLGRFALAAAFIVIGVMGVGHSAGWLEPTLRHYAAAILIVFGTALLISTLFGRARWLIVVGLILSPLLISMALLKVPFEGGFGDTRYEPATTAEVQAEYRLIAGQQIIDLSNLEVADGEVVAIEASVVFGRLEIIAPLETGFDAVAKVDAGEMFLDGQRGSQLGQPDSDNINVERNLSYEGTGMIQLEAHVGFGELVIFQEEAAVEEGTDTVDQGTEVTP
jgi:phage shock protein PspC (stress-responsive transcriptional regulator)